MASSESVPYAQNWLDVEAAAGGRTVLDGSVQDMRDGFATFLKSVQHLRKPLPDSLNIEDFTIPEGPAMRVYIPKETSRVLPLGVYYHGGGWILGDLDSEDHYCRNLAISHPMIIVSVCYRLAPENPYPIPLDDCVKGFEWAIEHATEFGASADNVIVIGTSAGANLAIATTLRLLDAGAERTPKGIVAMIPPTIHPQVLPASLSRLHQSRSIPDTPLIVAETVDSMYEWYGAAPSDPCGVSVLLHPCLNILPPTYIVACGKDPLRDDAILLGQALRKSGVPVKMDEYKGYPHHFWNNPTVIKGEEQFNNVLKGLEWIERQSVREDCSGGRGDV